MSETPHHIPYEIPLQELGQAWQDFYEQNQEAYRETLTELSLAHQRASEMEPGDADVIIGATVIKISSKPRHARYGEPAPESLSALPRKWTTEEYVEASKAWYIDYEEWKQAKYSPAYIIRTPWKCPPPPPTADPAVTFYGSNIQGFYITAQDESGRTEIYITETDVLAEAIPYLQHFLTQWENTDPNSFEDKILYTTLTYGDNGEPIHEPHYRTAENLREDHEHLGTTFKELLNVLQYCKPPPQTKPYPAKIHRISFTADLGIQNAIRATGDPLRFIPNPSHGTAEARDNPKSPVSFVIDATRNAEIWTTISNSDDDRIAYINEAVAQQTGLLSRDSGITNAYMLGRLLQSDGQVEIGIGELQKVRGKTKRTPEEKEQLTYEIKQAFELWGTAKLRGSREWRQDKGKKELVEFEDSFWHCTPVYPNGQGPLTGFYGPPCGFILVDSTVTKLYRRHPTMLHAIGSLDPFLVLLAESGKVAADWAVSMGWASLHYGRTNAQTSGDKIKLKRRTLLTAYKPHTSVQSLIDAGRLSRMTTYWTEAIKKLKRLKIWESIEEPPKPADPQGWAEKWLDQTVIITLGGDYQQHTQAVQRARKTGLDEIKKRTSKKPKKP